MILEFDRNGQPENMVSTLMDSVQRAIKPVEQISSAAYESGSDSEDIVGMIKDIMLEAIYPVGSYYETSNTEFNPNGVFLGVWVLETEGQVHVSSGENYTVAGALTNVTDGGEATHLLTSEESGMPAHNHTQNAHSHAGLHSGSVTGTAVKGGSDYCASGDRSGVGSHSAATATIYTSDATAANNAATAKNASSAHNNMQPYVVVNRWHRTE